jgi:hypothetical protein
MMCSNTREEMQCCSRAPRPRKGVEEEDAEGAAGLPKCLAPSLTAFPSLLPQVTRSKEITWQGTPVKWVNEVRPCVSTRSPYSPVGRKIGNSPLLLSVLLLVNLWSLVTLPFSWSGSMERSGETSGRRSASPGSTRRPQRFGLPRRDPEDSQTFHLMWPFRYRPCFSFFCSAAANASSPAVEAMNNCPQRPELQFTQKS